ncbi:Arylsulfatase [Pirellulimonas nuda]|uniref:Arylsulfatase n=1 Tax=Pirellulimonas nuda TaxID=2528009 RepID=A0A518DHH1_9BACT|nr:sulfatase [Pirellulimonas nuda]QDU90921.1 Arylsulfatase [Pirellulimonas nuda]
MQSSRVRTTAARHVVAAVCLGALATTSATDAAQPHPNFLFILTEDQGAQLGFVGTPGVETPHMDSIANQGVYFAEAFVNYPVCSASKANIYTGLHSHANGIATNTVNYFKPDSELSEDQRTNGFYQRLRVPDDTPTLVELLKKQGYFTGVSDKLHVAPNSKFPYDRWDRVATGDKVEQFAGEATAEGRPWFYFCNIEQPHRPFRNGDEVKLTVERTKVEVPAFLPDTPEVRQDWAEYLDAVERADEHVGDVLAGLERSGQAGQTIVIFMGDHGPAFHRGKMSPYDFGLRVPLAVRGPGVQQGVVSDELVSEIDLMPTILQYAGIEVPNGLHGQSLLPLLDGVSTSLPGRETVVGEVTHGLHAGAVVMEERAIYDGRYRLIYRSDIDGRRDFNADLQYWVTPGDGNAPWHNRSFDSVVANREEHPEAYRLLDETCSELGEFQPAELELYDVQADPYEVNNLADDPDSAGVRTRLLRALIKHAADTSDAAITPAKLTSLIKAGERPVAAANAGRKADSR